MYQDNIFRIEQKKQQQLCNINPARSFNAGHLFLKLLLGYRLNQNLSIQTLRLQRCSSQEPQRHHSMVTLRGLRARGVSTQWLGGNRKLLSRKPTKRWGMVRGVSDSPWQLLLPKMFPSSSCKCHGSSFTNIRELLCILVVTLLIVQTLHDKHCITMYNVHLHWLSCGVFIH